jgi:hypothetical protein
VSKKPSKNGSGKMASFGDRILEGKRAEKIEGVEPSGGASGKRQGERPYRKITERSNKRVETPNF